MHKDITFVSCLDGLMDGYVKEKRAVGYKYTKSASILKQLDLLIAKQHLVNKKLPKETVILWTQKRPNETESTRNARISIARGFAAYLVRLEYEAYIYPPRAVTIDRYSYVPYIFSEEEIKRIFIHSDGYPVSDSSPNRHLVLPLILRMLYGCGLRISEAVSLQIEDVDLEDGTLTIRNAKFGKDRIVPVAETLLERCRLYMRAVHGYECDRTFFFPSPYGGHYAESTIYKLFREILWSAGISHTGKGPRLHDLRHTFSVHCLKQWVTNEEDLTNLLPYLSKYLGHNDLRGTQHYLRLTADLYPTIVACVEQTFSYLIPEVEFYEAD